jgi:hypothetical protein
MALAVGQVEQPVSHQGRGAVGLDVVQTRREQGPRLVDREVELDHRRPEDLDPRRERFGIEGERATVVGTLIERHLALGAERAPFAGAQARGLR